MDIIHEEVAMKVLLVCLSRSSAKTIVVIFGAHIEVDDLDRRIVAALQGNPFVRTCVKLVA